MKRSNILSLLSVSVSLLAGLFLTPVCSAAETGNTHASPKVIAIRKDASPMEVQAANEIRRYVYLRTGALLPVTRDANKGDRIVISRKDAGICGALGKELGSQQFTLKTSDEGGQRVWWIVGGDEVGTLNGSYRFAEALGVHFSIEGDVVPDEPMSGKWPEVNETGIPRFALRGLLPWHNFSLGPDWWNLQDYESVLTQMAKMRMNFIGFHTYASWNPACGPNANVWVGLPEDVDEQGNVRFGYEAGEMTTRRGWKVTPYPTSKYASGAGLLFEEDEYGADFMLGHLDWPKTSEGGTEMFNRYGDLQQKAFTFARRLGIKTCVGTEFPLGVPKLLAAKLESKGMNPEAPAVIQSLYEGTFLRIMRKMPIDYYWFWTPGAWMGVPGRPGWENTSTANVGRSLALAEAAVKAVKPPFGFATSGWKLGTKDDPLWMDKHAPKSWAAASLNTGIGNDPVSKTYGAMPDRSKWVIPWAEDDTSDGAHCCTCWDLQFFGKRIFAHAADAARYGADGLMAIHWRTAALAPNFTALSQAGWRTDITEKPVDMELFWSHWGRSMFGGESGVEAGRILQKLDGSHGQINRLVKNGAPWKVTNDEPPGADAAGEIKKVAKPAAKKRTTDEEINQCFEPLTELEALRSRIKGIGNLERYDYWLYQIRASKLRVQTFVMSYRLTGMVKEIKALTNTEEKARRARSELLPLRLAVVRSYEELIATLVACAKSPGEVGTISSIESGRGQLIVLGEDKAIAKLLGEPLPAEAAIRTAYRGVPRVFVSAARSLSQAGEPQEIRAFVLSAEKCSGVNLYWRPLGNGSFQKVAATHRTRQAYRVNLPTVAAETVEYYLEAVLADGQKTVWPATAPALNQTVVAIE